MEDCFLPFPLQPELHSVKKWRSIDFFPDIDYDELLALVEQKAVQLFDVREPNELQETGRIPTAINIPGMYSCLICKLFH